MALDASIFRRFAPKSVAEFDAEYAAADNAKQVNALNALKMQGAQREFADADRARAEQAALSQLLGDPSFDRRAPNALQRLYQTAPTKAAGVLKDWRDADKSEADIAETKAKTKKTASDAATDTMKRYRGALDFIDTPQGAARWLQSQYADPVIAGDMQALGPLEEALKRIPQDPQAFTQWRQQAALGMESYMQRMGEKETRAQAAKRDAEAGRHNRASEGIAQGNLAVSRDRLAHDKLAPKGQIIETADGFMLADPRAGTAAPLKSASGEPVKGKPGAAGTSTESERTAGFLLQRVRDSQRQLAAALKDDPSAAKPGIAQEVARAGSETLANSMTGAARQRVESAQLDILDAALTLGTGAAYTKEQLQGYRKSYFPQIGDSDKAVADKQQRLQNLIRAAETKAGRSAADTGNKAPESNAVDEALKKYGG
jgi:hypothetical protein